MDEPIIPDPAPPRATWLRWLIFLGIIAALAGFYALGLHEYFDWD